jgi:hypothetical protein
MGGFLPVRFRARAAHARMTGPLIPRKGVDRVANKVDLPIFDDIQPLRPTMGRTSSLGDTWRRTHKRSPGERAQGIHAAHDAVAQRFAFVERGPVAAMRHGARLIRG